MLFFFVLFIEYCSSFQAEYELEATRAIIESRAWEPLVEEAPKGQWDWPIV